MGTFGGHILPGVVLLIYGIRWAYCSMRRYFLCRRELALVHGRSSRFRSSLTFPVSCCPGFPLEAAILLFTVVIIIGLEITRINSRGYIEVSQHLIMYSCYGFVAAAMILKHYRYQMVPDVDYVCLILTFVVITFLLQRHTMGKSTLEVQVHQNSMMVLLTSALVVALEMKYRQNAILPMLRAFLFCLNGSWLIMEDFMLWYPGGKWPNEDPKWIMLATISFGGHIVGLVLLMSLINIVALRVVMSFSPAQVSLYLDREGLGQKWEMGHKFSALTSEQCEGLLTNCDDDV